MADIPGLDALRLALYPVAGATEQAGPLAMLVNGTINIIGGGSGGTSMIDNNPFTPGGTSITPFGGYFSGGGSRPLGSGNAAAVSIDASANLKVNVVAGGAGGGVANLTVRGSGNTDLHVGYVGGSSVNSDGGAYMPILGTVNLGAGAAPFATVGVYGSPGFPIYNVGSVNVVNSVGIFGSVSGAITGSVGVTPLASFTVNLGGVATVWLANQNAGSGFATAAVYGSPNFPVYAVGSVNVVNAVGIFGSVSGAFATMAIYGSPAFPAYFQFPSGYYPTFNSAGGGGGFATAAVYGSPGFPVYAIGTVNVSNAIGIFGSTNVIGSVNVQGSLGVGQIGSPWGVAGSIYATVNVLGSVSVLGTVNMGGVGVVDVRGSLVPTQWLISFGGSGASQVAAAAPANQRIWLSSFHLIATGTTDLMWQSPSGIAISGSMRILPGAGFGLAGAMPNGPVVMGSLNSPLFLNGAGTQNVGGIALGWVA